VRFADDLLRNLARADVASHFSHAFARPLVETDVPVRSTIATRITNDA
jgi:phosphatidylserine decarboxylase